MIVVKAGEHFVQTLKTNEVVLLMSCIVHVEILV